MFPKRCQPRSRSGLNRKTEETQAISTRAEMQRSIRVLAGSKRVSAQLPRVGGWPSFERWAPFRTRWVKSLAQSHSLIMSSLSIRHRACALTHSTVLVRMQRHGHEFKGDSRKPRSVGPAVSTALPKQGIHFNTHLAFANVSFPPMRLFLTPPLPMKIKHLSRPSSNRATELLFLQGDSWLPLDPS